eukprot:TCONS_00016605-protein
MNQRFDIKLEKISVIMKTLVIVTAFFMTLNDCKEVPTKAEIQEISGSNDIHPNKDYFGKNVKINNDSLFVLANNDVYVYRRTNHKAKTLNQIQKFTVHWHLGSPGNTAKGPGITLQGIAIDNDYLFVQMALGWDSNSRGIICQCQVYILKNGLWEYSRSLRMTVQSYYDLYGFSMSAHNGTLVITSPSRFKSQYPAGKIYIHTIGSWKREELYKLGRFAFGISAAIYNDTISVGDTSCTNTTHDCQVYIYYHYQSEQWVEQQAIFPENKTHYGKFGSVVALNEKFLFVIGYEKSSKGYTRTVFVYKKAVFYQTVKYDLHQLLPDTAEIYDPIQFTTITSSLSTYGNYLVAGTAALNHDGSVFVYTYNDFTDTWIQKERLLPSHRVNYFGCSVATTGNLTVVGSDFSWVECSPDGQVFVYSTWVPPATPMPTTTQSKITHNEKTTTSTPGNQGSSMMVTIISICSAFLVLTFIIVAVCYRFQKYPYKRFDEEDRRPPSRLPNIAEDLHEGSELILLETEELSLAKEECNQRITEYFQKCHFEAMSNDREMMEYKPLAKQEDSAFLFPTTIRRFLAGSRAERLFIESSDYDFIYEVGPGMVTPDFKEGQEECRFYCTPTMNIGFYYVFDSNKQKLSPATLQAKMFAQIMDPIKAGSSVFTELEKRQESQAALPTKDVNDHVLALRLNRWPKYVHECIKDQLSDEIFRSIKEKPLYLVCKSHPSSSDENKDYEWRLSFSVLEIEIAKLINDNLRRSYLMCKHLLAKTKLLRFPRKCHVKSYELKTVFMWLSRELDTFEGQEYDQVELTLSIFQRLLEHYEEQNLPNFFLPQQNILDTNKEEKMIEGRKFLKNYFSDEYHIAQLIEILGKNG